MSTESHSSNLQLEHLFRAAFKRTKDRFLSYFLSWLLFYAIGIGAVIAIALIVGLHFLVFAVTKSPAVVGTLAFISTIGALVGLMYLGAWGTLSTTLVLISDKAIGVTDAMKEVKPIIWRYLGFSLLMTLFILGIFSISIFTLFILLFVWMVWGSFALFIFLEDKKPGLQALWKSKAMTKGRFWGIFGRIVLVYVALYVIVIAFSVGAANYRILNVLSFVISLFIGPFIISYLYEIYKNIPKADSAKQSTGWIIASVVGWLLLVLGIVSTISSAAQASPKIMQNVEKQMMMKKTRSI
jgi:hypothetical protein